MSLSNNLQYIQHIEHFIGQGHPLGLDDSANRPLKELISKFDNGEADTQVFRNFFTINSEDLEIDVVDDDLVELDSTTLKWKKSDTRPIGIIDVSTLRIYIFGKYTLKNETSLIAGEKYFLDSNNDGEYTTSEISTKVVGDAISNDTMIITTLSGTIVNPTIFTDPPTISGPTGVVETIPTEYTITDYNPTFEYILSSSFGTVSRSGDIITFTPIDVAITTAGSFEVTARDIPNSKGVSTETVTNVNILGVEDDSTDSIGSNDGIILYTGVTMSSTEFPSPVNGIINSNVLNATSDNAIFESVSVSQEGGESDFVGIESIQLVQDGTDILLSADATECVVSVELVIGRKVFLTDGISFVFFELTDSNINLGQTTFTHSQSFTPIKCFVDFENSIEFSLDNGSTYQTSTRNSWNLSGNTITEFFENITEGTVGNRDIKTKLSIGKNGGTCKSIQGDVKKRI